jgi:hypothetical protein
MITETSCCRVLSLDPMRFIAGASADSEGESERGLSAGVVAVLRLAAVLIMPSRSVPGGTATQT